MVILRQVHALSVMSGTAFDALAAARNLEAAGLERAPAEAIAGTVRDATGADREQLATKADLATLRAEMRADLAAAISGLGRRFVGYGLAIAGLLFAALKLF